MQIYRSGIFLLLLILASIAFLVQWFAWIFGAGRFGKDATSGKTVSILFSEFTFKIINEFRHLLALLIVVIFSFALGYSLIKAASLPTSADTPSTIDNMKEALQAVVATLGGLVGSIIGYYFGESKPSTPDAGGTKQSAEVQNPPVEGKSDKTGTKAPAPPASATSTGSDTAPK